MTQPRSSPHNLPETEEEYRRWCTLRNPAFVTALRDFRKRWPSPPSFPPPQVGLRIEAIKQYQAQERAYLAELVKFCNPWPTITPDDVIGGATTAPGPKVQLAPYSPLTWPRDGSIPLYVHPATTGEEIKKAWREIKAALRQGRTKRVSGQWMLKSEIYELYYNGGMKIAGIAKKLKKPVSTVAYLLGSVCQDIGRVRVKGQKRMDLAFDFGEHFPNCAECQRRQNPCRFAEENMGLSEHGLREVTVGDITQAERMQLRLQQGRKLPRKIDY